MVVAVTRPVHRVSKLTSALEAHGATVIGVPAIELCPPHSFAALDDCLARIEEYQWLVFTSAAATDVVGARLARIRGSSSPPASVRIAVVGSATAATTRAALGRVDFVGNADADALALAMPASPGDRVLFACGDRARDALSDRLKELGAIVDRVVTYRTQPIRASAIATTLQMHTVDAMIIASPSAASVVGAALESAALEFPLAVCIGHTTAEAASNAGFSVAAIAAAHTDEALVEATIHALTSHHS